MKIICKDNYDRETVSEYVVAEKIYNEIYGKLICKLLNDDEGEYGDNYYKLVEDDYKLYKFEP